MKAITLSRILIGGILAGIALYYTMQVTVHYIIFDTDIYSPVSASDWVVFAFRCIPGIVFAFVYWRAGALLGDRNPFVKGVTLGVLFSLLNESLLPTNLYDMIRLGNYLAATKFMASALLINILLGCLIVFIIPVHPIGEKK
jgi:hypothetical protein